MGHMKYIVLVPFVVRRRYIEGACPLSGWLVLECWSLFLQRVAALLAFAKRDF